MSSPRIGFIAWRKAEALDLIFYRVHGADFFNRARIDQAYVRANGLDRSTQLIGQGYRLNRDLFRLLRQLVIIGNGHISDAIQRRELGAEVLAFFIKRKRDAVGRAVGDGFLVTNDRGHDVLLVVGSCTDRTAF